MTPNQKKYYLMGLKDAAREIALESECAEYTMQGESLNTYQHTCETCKALLEELIEGLQNNP